jgi:uncharacterized membrane protein
MRISSVLKSSFVAGLILLTPLIITLFVLQILINWSLQVIDPIVQGTRLVKYTANIEAVAQILAVVVILMTITLLGYLAQKSVGRRMFGNIGRIVNVIPLINTIYASVRQVANSLVERDTAYESVVLVEYPREDVYSLGLVTGEGPSTVEDFAGREVYNVFLPNSPNPTAGRLVLLPEDQIHEIDMSVRHGMRLIVTTGIGSEEESLPLPK